MTSSHPLRRALAPLLLGGLLLLAACGGGGYVGGGGWDGPGGVYEPYGSVDVDNLSPEYVETFFLAPAATGAWSGELLGWPLAPGETAWVGDFLEDAYDAEADMEYGDLVQWFDVFVPAGDVTVFEVW